MNRPDLSVVTPDAAEHLSDDTLQGLVDGFLEASERATAERHLEVCATCRRVRDVLGGLAARSTGPAPGDSLGRFRLLEEVGHGSVGRVFSAWDPVLSRRVAVKVLKPELGALPRAQQLLLREAQALARLTHPHVVAVHDAGSDRGATWLAMEFVEGTTFKDWLAANPRRTHDILERFREACAGLAAAHRVGLLHRDFKPGNLMLGADGRLRVTDFGLAALAQEATGGVLPVGAALEASLTDTGALVGTPAYLAPEQWEGRPASNATDQFSVAVTLFEALTGRRPFDGVTATERLTSIRRGPRWPASTRLPRALKAAITRALSVEPGDRFPSIEAFGAALAQVDRRRTALVALSALTAGVLVLAPVAGVLFERARSRCGDLAQQLHGVWDEPARVALTQAGRGALVASVDAWAASWLQARAESCRAEAETGVPARAQVTCLEEQRRLLDAVLREVLAENAVSTAQAMEAVAGLPPASVCTPSARPPEEEFVDQSAIRAALALNRVDDAQRLASQLEVSAQARQAPRALAVSGLLLAEVAQQRGLLVESEQRLRDAIARGEKARADDVVAEAWVHLTHVVGISLRRPEEGLRLADLAKSIVEARGRAIDAADLELVRAELLRVQGRADDGLAQVAVARAAIERAWGPTHWKLSRVDDTEAKLLQAQHKSQASLEVLERAERRALASLPEHHPTVLTIRGNRVVALTNLRRFAQAEQETRALLKLVEVHLPDAPIHGHALLNLGRVLKAQDRPDEALPVYLEALAFKERLFGKGHIESAMVMNNIAAVMAARGLRDETLAWHLRAYEVRLKALPPDHLDVVMSLVNLGHSYQELGRCGEALPFYQQALEKEERSLGPTAPAIAEELTGLGECWLELGQAAKALPVLERAVALRAGVTGEDGDPSALAQSRLALARALVATGRERQRAEALARQAAPDVDAEHRPALEALVKRAGWPRSR